MNGEILLPSVRKEIEAYLATDRFLNPGWSEELDRVFALDKGVSLDFCELSQESLPDPENDGEYVQSSVVEVDVVMSSVDQLDEAGAHRSLSEWGEYGEQLMEELLDVFTSSLRGYNTERTLDFGYMGEWKKGHIFKGHLYFDKMSGVDVTPVEVSLSASASVTRNVPADVVAQGEEAVLLHLIDTWWRRTDRSTKARMLDISNEFIPTTAEEKKLGSMQDHMGVEMRVEVDD